MTAILPPVYLSQEQFDALASYVEAAVRLAVAESRPRSEDDEYGTLHEYVRLGEARDAAEKALVNRPS